MALLRIDAGPNVGAEYVLANPSTKIGRNPECDIQIQVGAVSRVHAEAFEQSGLFFIRDLNSRNKTYLNDQEVVEPKQLRTGDRIRVCDVTFSFLDSPRLPSDSGERNAVLVETDSSGSTIMSKVDVSSGSSGVTMAASPEVKLAALVEISHSLGKAVGLDEVLPQVLATLFKIFVQADRGFIVLKGPDGELIPRWTQTRREQDDTIRISKTIISQVIDSKEAILSADAAGDARFDMSQSVADVRIRSMMCAPLLDSDGEAIGVLQIDTLDQRKRFAAEDLEVLASIAIQAGIAINNAQLYDAAARQKWLERDLEVAREVQQSFLPSGRPQLPGYEFFDYYEPANHVGGDYYDYITLPDGSTAVIVADVVGHGVAAALLMAKLAAEARFHLATAATPAQALTRLNDAISRLQVEARFITFVMSVLNPTRHEVTIVNAGHMCPIVRRDGGQIEEPGEEEGGLVMGVMEDIEYEQVTIPLGPGESLTMYTDGLNESMKGNDQYGIPRIRQHVQQDESLQEMGESLIADIHHFVGDDPQDDDMCLVCFKRLA